MEKYLEYLFLISILDNNVSAGELTKGRPDVCEMWFTNNTKGELKLNKVKNRVTALEKELLENYVIVPTSKEV